MKHNLLMFLFCVFSIPVMSQLNYEKFLFDSTRVYMITIPGNKPESGKIIAKENHAFIFKSDSTIDTIPVSAIANIEMVESKGTVPLKRPTLLVYNNTESNYVFDIGGGLGTGSTGFQFGVMGNLDIYYILAGVHYSTDALIRGMGKYKIDQLALLAGYRYRNRYILLSLAGGYAWQKFLCTSGMNYDCIFFKDETIGAFPLHFHSDFIISENMALGVNVNMTSSDRQDINAILFCIKFGNFRE